MTATHVPAEPHDSGELDVGEGHRIHWEIAGNPDGKPAVLLHGGPGSGLAARHRRQFDPDRYLLVSFDQRQCGRSTPSAADPVTDLATNTTAHLVADIEALRRHVGIDRWLVWGGSWGTTLGLAYAQAHPGSVTELLLGSVVTTSSDEVDWVTRAMGRVFPEAWRAFVEAVPADRRNGNLAAAYNELLLSPDPAVHGPAADAWCQWEDVHVSVAYGYEPGLVTEDPSFRLCFARLVTHYWANAGFLEEGRLLADAGRLEGIPTFIAHGRRDISAPAAIPVALAGAIPGATLFIAEDEGHGGPKLTEWMVSITDRLAD